MRKVERTMLWGLQSINQKREFRFLTHKRGEILFLARA